MSKCHKWQITQKFHTQLQYEVIACKHNDVKGSAVVQDVFLG